MKLLKPIKVEKGYLLLTHSQIVSQKQIWSMVNTNNKYHYYHYIHFVLTIVYQQLSLNAPLWTRKMGNQVFIITYGGDFARTKFEGSYTYTYMDIHTRENTEAIKSSIRMMCKSPSILFCHGLLGLFELSTRFIFLFLLNNHFSVFLRYYYSLKYNTLQMISVMATDIVKTYLHWYTS